MSFSDDTVANSIKLICSYLNRNKIRYVIVGGMSVLAWGRIRTTEDIDLIIDHKSLNISDFVQYLEKNNFSVDESDFDGFKSKDHCTIFYKDGMFRIDIIGIYNEDNKISIEESQSFKFQDLTIKIDAPESLIAHKLLFGSQQDYEDALAIFTRIEDKIDLNKLKSHASRLKIEKKLQNFLDNINKI